MTTIPIISQLKSLVQVCTGDADGAKKTWDEFWDAWTTKTAKTIGDLVDGIPIIGHVKGIVHFAMGDTDAGAHAEEAATRTLVVVGAAALTGATEGLAAPILAGVVADGFITGIESARKGDYEPEGMVGVATNIVRDIRRGEVRYLGGDIFDGVVIATGDGIVGKSAVEGVPKETQTTRVYRVEGESLIKDSSGFKAGDNQRIFEHKGAIVARERLPPMRSPETLAGGSDDTPTGAAGGSKKAPEVLWEPNYKAWLRYFNPSAFEDNGQMIFLNFGNVDRMYEYYAQKLIDHRQFVKEYLEKYEQDRGPGDPPSRLTEKHHNIRVKSFEIRTEEYNKIKEDAVREAEKAQAVKDKTYLGVLQVDLRSEGQYGLENHRYTPIFNKMVKGSPRIDPLWIKHLPTPILKLIRDHPIAAGKVRRFKYANLAGSVTTGTNRKLTYEDVSVDPQNLVHCRHVKTMAAATTTKPPEWSEHFEYLVKRDSTSPAEWYPEQLVAEDLQQKFYENAMKSSKPVVSFKGRDGDKLLVERPDGSVDKIGAHQIFWNEQEPYTDLLSTRELDAVLYHIHNEGADTIPPDFDPIPEDALVIGSWEPANTSRPPDGATYSSRLTLGNQNASVPTLVTGIDRVDMGNDKWKWAIRIRTFADEVDSDTFTVHINSWGDTSLWNARISFMLLYPVGPMLQCGIFRSDVEGTFKKRIYFNQAFERQPIVYVGLSGWDITDNWRINVEANNITQKSFDIEITTWGSSDLYSASATWIAYDDIACPNICSGTIQGDKEHGWDGLEVFCKQTERRPRLFTALSYFDINHDKWFRFKLVRKPTQQGFKWSMEKWGETELYCVKVNWFAIC